MGVTDEDTTTEAVMVSTGLETPARDMAPDLAVGENNIKLKADENGTRPEDAAEDGSDLETAAKEAVTIKAVGAGEEETDAQDGGDLSAESCPSLA